MEFKQFGSQINIGKRALITLFDNSHLGSSLTIMEDLMSGKIDIFAEGKKVGELTLTNAALAFLKSGGKLKTKSVSQFKKEIK